MEKNKQQQVINNFLSSLDLEIPMVYHFKNAMKDAFNYKWKSEILVEIMAGIENAYNKIKEEK